MIAHRVRTIVALAAATLLVVALAVTAGASPSVRSAPTRDTKVVKGIVNHWSPATVRISAGDTITWKASSGTHTVTAYGGGWSFNHGLPQGGTVNHRFGAAGTFRFRCTIHSTLAGNTCTGMCGKVVVST